jgi:hypothetical protein
VFGEPVSISNDLNDRWRQTHISFATVENPDVVAAIEQSISQMPSDESGSA